MKKIGQQIIVFFVVISAYQFYLRGGLRWPLSASNLSADSCAGRELCVLVYMAPWCPHCKTAIPKVKSYLNRAQKGGTAGFRVVVGMDSPENSMEMGLKIGKGVAIDRDREIAKKYAIDGVPAYIVLDREGGVVLRGAEANQWLFDKFGG